MSETMLALILKRLDTLDELKQIVYSLRDGQEEIRAELEGLSLTVAKLEGRMTKVEADVAELKRDVAILKADVAELKTTQSRQDELLALLSYRSLDHESQLRSFRKAN